MTASVPKDEPKPSLFASTHAYTIRKQVGAEAWPTWIEKELASLGSSHVPGFATLGQAALLREPLEVSVSAGTLLARERSCMGGAFLRSSADVWLTVDDDNYADVGVLRRLVAAARETRSLVAAPSWMRVKPARLSFIAARPRATFFGNEMLVTDERLLTGFGICALHRELVETVAKASTPFRDENHGDYPAMFLETIRDGLWVGEDFMFCHRAADAGLTLYLLANAFTEHAGVGCEVTMQDGALCARRVEPSQRDTEPVPPTTR